MSLAPLPEPVYCIASSSHFHVVGISVSETVLDTNLRSTIHLFLFVHSFVRSLIPFHLAACGLARQSAAQEGPLSLSEASYSCDAILAGLTSPRPPKPTWDSTRSRSSCVVTCSVIAGTSKSVVACSSGSRKGAMLGRVLKNMSNGVLVQTQRLHN